MAELRWVIRTVEATGRKNEQRRARRHRDNTRRRKRDKLEQAVKESDKEVQQIAPEAFHVLEEQRAVNVGKSRVPLRYYRKEKLR